MKRRFLALLLAAAMAFPTAAVAGADGVAAVQAAEAVESMVYLTEEKVFDGTEASRVEASAEELAVAKELESATVTVDFKTTNGGVLQSLAAINGSEHSNDYIALYTNGANRIGFELRNYTGTAAQVNEHRYVDLENSLGDGEWHTVTLRVEKNEGYAIFVDGQKVWSEKSNSTWFAGTEGWWDAASMTFGGAKRISGNSYLYTGSMKNVKVYAGALTDAEVLADHPEYVEPEVEIGYPEGVVKSEEYGIFDMGDYESFNYRIPAMVTTKNGVVIAAADQRNDHWSDWGNIDTVIRRSTDNGNTWEDPIEVIDLKSQPYDTGTQSAFLIDPVLISTEEGRVWMLVDMFPEGTGFSSITQTGSGFVEAEDGVKYLELTDASGNSYTLRGNEVYDSEGNKTSYTVDLGTWDDAFHSSGDLYDDGEYVGNIYLSSKNANNDAAPLSILRTTYLWLTYSDDDGETWSNPVNVSGMVKEEWMKFCGVGPGFGIELKNGEYAGRLVFPIYYTNAAGFQSSACMYSDDGGVTWERGESPNDGRINSSGVATDSQNPSGISQLTESQIIELSSGNLLQFMRNYGGAGKVAVARSTDGGATWSDPINTSATEVYCQLSVLYMDNNGTDGKDRVLMSNSGGSGRNNGTLRIGEVTETEDSFTVEWVAAKLFCPGNYAYSCLTEMADGNYGLLYEHNNTIKFTYFNEAYIHDDTNLLSPTISSVTYDVEKATDSPFAMPGDTYVFEVTVNQDVTVEGTPQFRFKLNTESRYADFAEISEDERTLTFKYLIQEGDEGTISFRGPKIINDDKGTVKNVQGYGVSAGDMVVALGMMGPDPSYNEDDIPTNKMTATAGDFQSGEGADKAIDGSSDTTWHTDWYTGPNHDNHWLQLELEEVYAVDGFRYQPRQSGTNGIITAYEIHVSLDGEEWTKVAEGSWNGDSSWKNVEFDPVEAKYVKLVTVDAMSDQSVKFASAAEVRVTGKPADEVADCEHKNTEVEKAAEATCTEDGYTGDTVCADCNKILEKGEAIEALGHEMGEWTVVTEPTADAEGLEVSSCGRCDHEEERAIPKLEEPTPAENPFEDVTEADYFYNSVLWAVENNVTAGITPTTFEPYTECNRAQIVLFLYRAMKGEAADIENPFADVSEADYCYDAVLWAVENGITTGITENTFEPWKSCSRAEIVTFLWRAMGAEEVATDKTFPDVNTGDFFYDAVAWAVENGVTQGRNDGTFGAWLGCWRADAVTFIQRAVEK